MKKSSPPQQNSPSSRAFGDNDILHLCVPAERSAVIEARKAVNTVFESVGLTADESGEMDLALGEALANAITHGLESGNDHSVEIVYISMWDFQNHLILEITNHGEPFRAPDPPYEMPEASRHDTHGRGLPLMEMLTDALAVCENGVDVGGASIYLVKSMHSRVGGNASNSH